MRLPSINSRRFPRRLKAHHTDFFSYTWRAWVSHLVVEPRVIPTAKGLEGGRDTPALAVPLARNDNRGGPVKRTRLRMPFRVCTKLESMYSCTRNQKNLHRTVCTPFPSRVLSPEFTLVMQLRGQHSEERWRALLERQHQYREQLSHQIREKVCTAGGKLVVDMYLSPPPSTNTLRRPVCIPNRAGVYGDCIDPLFGFASAGSV